MEYIFDTAILEQQKQTFLWSIGLSLLLSLALSFLVLTISGKKTLLNPYNKLEKSETDLRIAKEEIEKSSERARLVEAVVVNARDAVIITKANLENPEIIYVNKAFTQISGYEPNEIIGKTPRILQGKDTSRKALNTLRDTLSKGKPYKGTN